MEGLTTIQSNFGPRETMERLEAEIKARGMTVFARINHAALAAEVSLALGPTEVIIFGNPRGGTPLMEANQTIGIDLPLKALVWQDAAEKTWLSYNEPNWLAQRHNVTGAERVLAGLTQVLAEMATKATKEISSGGPDVKSAAAVPVVGKDASGDVVKPTGPAPSSVAPAPAISLIPRFIAIGVVMCGIVGLFLYAGGWLTPNKVTPAKIVDRFENVSGGAHPGFRRNHAKGVCVSGFFKSNGQGVEFSKAAIFQPGRVPVIGRFSLAGGMPNVVDTAAAVRGLGILFQLPNGEEWRTAMVTLPVFPASTPEAFYELMLASAPEPSTGKPNPAAMQAFLSKYPETGKAFQIIGGQPKVSGFADSTFNGLNAFRLISASDAVSSVRWSWVPVGKSEPASTADSWAGGTNELFDAVIAAIHRQPLQWHLMITIARPGDTTADATTPWPPDRKQVDVGTLTLDHIESDDTSVARDINFDPLVLPNGMAASDDPLLSARSAVYSKSFTRREGEPKAPSAISTAETEK